MRNPAATRASGPRMPACDAVVQPQNPAKYAAWE
jgi:hypothetical protein